MRHDCCMEVYRLRERVAALESELAREQEIYQDLSAALADANDDADRGEARIAALVAAGDALATRLTECLYGQRERLRWWEVRDDG